jgi:hypothetical protein
LKQNVFQLELKVKEASEQLRKAKSELNGIYSEVKSEDKENHNQNQNGLIA